MIKDVIIHNVQRTPNTVATAPRIDKPAMLSGEADIVRGLFQCVKYRAVLEAQHASEGLPQSARAILALGAKLPSKLQALKNVLGVEMVDEV